MSKPVCVITGDIHFNLQTLELASSALRQMLAKAKELNAPAVLNGDTLDQKALIRGEVANRLIEILETADPTQVYINTGNHDLINQKATESSLNFLRPYTQVVSVPTYVEALKSWIVPYFSDNQNMQDFLNTVPKGSRLIVHQGVIGADLGHYVKDSSSLPPESFADFRTVASHFHKRQDIKCGRPRKGAVGLFSYCGSPYSISFSEANDGPKGINVLYDDGTLELVPTNLRKHWKLELDLEGLQLFLDTGAHPATTDLVWLVVRGPASELAKIKKLDIMKRLDIAGMKFDKIPTETERLDAEEKQQRSGAELMDAVVDKTDEPPAEKARLKSLWRELVAA